MTVHRAGRLTRGEVAALPIPGRELTGPIRFDVRGLPQAQGSARAFIAGGRAMIATEANRPRSPLGAWRTAVAAEARAAMGTRQVVEGPLALSITFRMPRPKNHRGARGLKSWAPAHVASKPDLDKLLRAVLDALTGVVWRDDAQVAVVGASKQYDDGVIGCAIRIEPASNFEVLA